MGILVYIHLDDGFSFSGSREKALEASKQVREDLLRYGLLISESKCSWGARSVIEWTGFIWDTVKFQLSASEEKYTEG